MASLHKLSRRNSKWIVEKLWRELFSDPSQWWDNRAEKVNLKYPDFKHRKTQQPLWLTDTSNPPWVASQLAELPPHSIPVDPFTLNKRLARLVKSGHNETAIELFKQMQEDGFCANKFTFVPLLNACSRLRALGQGILIHAHAKESGYESDLYVGNALIDMYGKCGSLVDAQRVFENMPVHDVVSWNAMILGHVKSGHGLKALHLYEEMQVEGIGPNQVTFLHLLNACASMQALDKGRSFHAEIIKSGSDSDVFVCNALVDMYAKCESLDEAWAVFSEMPIRNVVAWSAMILGFVRGGQGERALALYSQMQNEGMSPNKFTFVAILMACSSLQNLEQGREIHAQIDRSHHSADVYVVNCLIDMYTKCGSLEDAWTALRKMPKRNAVAWNALIMGFVRSSQGLRALELYRQMQAEGVGPDRVSFLGMLISCASVAALEEARAVHQQIIRSNCESDVHIGCTLVDTYAKCGSIEDAERVFEKMPLKNVVAWNVMIGGYAMHGNAKEALQLFDQMCRESIEIDWVTVGSLLSACSHGGLVDEGLHLFESMSIVYGIPSKMEHYVCVVDLFGRAGRLQEAEDVIEGMVCKSDASVWMSLLSACRVHGNLEIGRRAAKWVQVLDSENPAGYILLSNIYAAAGKWNSSAIIKDVKKEMHSLRVDDCHHSELVQIHEERMERLSDQIEEPGDVYQICGKGSSVASSQ